LARSEKVFAEQVSATATRRPQLEAALEFVREGDTLIVTKPDRLARSVADLLFLVERLRIGVCRCASSRWAAAISTPARPRAG
jgi:DNA invertase Pin-like site-specific DNA recombinase